MLALAAVVLFPLLALTGLYGFADALADVAPVLDLTADPSTVSYETTFVEDGGPKAMVDMTGLTITDTDSAELDSAEATLLNPLDGAQESLAANAGATGLVVNYTTATGKLTISGDATIADYQQVMRTMTYLNLSQSPSTPDRSIVVTVSDGQSSSAPVTSTIAIAPVNDAPMLDNSGDMKLTPINEDEFASNGNSVTRIIESAEMSGENRITDPDAGAREGIAVIEAQSSNGVWQYSTTGGVSWLNFGAVSNTAAVLLDETARIRFVPLPNFNGTTVGILFRAWDQTQGQNGATGVNVSVNGGTTAFSTATETANVVVNSVNDLPQVDLNGPDAGIDYYAAFIKGSGPVAIATDSTTVTDVDHTMLASATVTLTNRPDGSEELLSTNALTTSITIVPYDSSTGQLVLNGPAPPEDFAAVIAQVRYNNNAVTPTTGNRSVQVVANDGVNNSPAAMAVVAVNPVNNAPVLNPAGPYTLNPIVEDSTSPAGDQVMTMIASAGGDAITDADAGALEGVAIIGAGNANGSWQYNITNPPDPLGWQPVGVVSNTAALLLTDVSWLRYVPAPDYSGPSDSLTFRAWDRTSGNNGQRNVNVSVNGANSAYSQNTASAGLTVTPVNDVPVLTPPGGDKPIYTEDETAVTFLDETFTLQDADSPTLASATVRLTNAPNGSAEQLSANVGATGLSAVFANNTLTISGPATPQVYEVVLRSVAYNNTSQDPSPADRIVEVSASDGISPSLPINVIVGVEPVNDPPVLDVNGSASGLDHEAVFVIKRGPASIVDPNLSASDVDNTAMVSATVRILNEQDGLAEVLTASVVGTNISRNYDTDTNTLYLTGNDSVANYQQVLRTLAYNNILPEPDQTERQIEFVMSDGTDDSIVAHTTLSFEEPPITRLYLPIAMPDRSEEPNDTCVEAVGLRPNITEFFRAEDTNDWYYFDLRAAADVTVELRDFTPGRGQLIVASGQGCGNLALVGSNGDSHPSKDVALGRRQPGRFYIWIINDGTLTAPNPYRLYIRATP